MTEVVVVIPWRDKGEPWRRANLAAVELHLHDLGWPVAVVSDGRSGSAPFNRSAAYNRAPTADVYIFHEADMLIPYEQLRRAVALAAAEPGMVVPFDTYLYLSRDETRRVRAGAVDYVAERVMADGRSNGACNVVSAETLRAVGRWDESFEGWGYDDRAMAVAFSTATGRPTRYVPGNGVHLWHTPGWLARQQFAGGSDDIAPEELAATNANRRRLRRYRKARTPEEVRALTAGG